MPEHVPIKSYVFFDCETTGLTAPRITEISFVAVHLAELELYCKHVQTLVQAQMSGKGNVNGFARHAYPRVLSKLTLAVNPMKRIDPMAEKITGLSNYSLEHQAKFKDGPAQTIIRFLESLAGPACLVAHNGNRFDFPVLQKEMERAGLKLREDILGVDSIVFLRDYYKKREFQASRFTPESFSKVARPLPFTASFQNSAKILTNSAITALEPEPDISALEPEPDTECEAEMIAEFEANYETILEVQRKATQDSQPHFTLELPEIEDEEDDDDNKDEKDDECLLNILQCSHELSTPTKQDGLLQQSPFMTPPHSAKKRSGLKEDGNEGEIKITKPDVLSSPLQAKPDILSSPSEATSDVHYPPLQNKPIQFSLPAVYKHLFGEEPEQSHGSEIDSLVLMRILAMYSTAFTQWAGENGTLLTNMKARK